jgi:malate permease and related proteins
LNTFVLWVSLPAVVLTQLPEVFENEGGFTLQSIFLAAMPWAIFGFTTVTTWIVGSRWGWSRATIGAVSLTAGLGNTSFVGYPLLEALYGRSSLGYAVIVDQPGSFLALSTAGIAVASFFSTSHVSLASVLRRMFTFPPLIAVLMVGAWVLFDLPQSEGIDVVLGYLGMTLAPLALVSVGWQLELDLSRFAARRREIIFGLGMKLVVSPIVILIAATLLLDYESLARQVVILEAAMAPMITAAVIAQEMELDDEVAQLLLSLGIPISLVTVPLWWILLE